MLIREKCISMVLVSENILAVFHERVCFRLDQIVTLKGTYIAENERLFLLGKRIPS